MICCKETIGTIEAELANIAQLPPPVSIILFGADCEFKNKVLRRLEQGCSEAKIFYGAPSTHEIIELIRGFPISIFVLSSMESSDHELRHECVKVMHNIGAKVVIGVHAKAKPPQPFSGHGFTGRPDLQLMKTTIKKLEQNPPTVDGLNRLLTINERWEEGTI